MQNLRQTTARDAAVTVCFAALYTILSFLPLSQLVGSFSKAITAATIIAPIIGIVLGAYFGALSTFLGGAIGVFVNPYFSPPSLVAGVVSSLFAGWLFSGKRSVCIFAYFSLLFFFGFYPFVGPVWLYPFMMWFQIAVFLILVSPLQSKALETVNSNPNNNRKLLPAFFIIALTSTLAGQIAGSVAFEVLSWPVFVADLSAWRMFWQVLTFLYPMERLAIAFIGAFILTPLYKILKTLNFLPFHDAKEGK